MKDDVEAIKARMHGTPSQCHEYETTPIKSKLATAGNRDCFHKEDHIGSDLEVEDGGNSLKGDEVVGDDCNCEDADDDGKGTGAEDGILSSKSSTLEGEIGEEKFMLSWVSEERDAVKVQTEDQIQTGGFLEGSLLGKLPGATVGNNNISSTIGADKLISGKLPFAISGVFKWSYKGFVLDHTKGSVAAYQWVSAAGYPILELLIAWENYKLLTGQLHSYRLEDKSSFGAGSIDMNPILGQSQTGSGQTQLV